MKCYVLGAVMGGTESSKEIFETYKSALKGKVEIIGTPLETAEFNGTTNERFCRAEKSIRNVDLVIADMSVVSTGAGIEMGMAYLLGKKIMVFAKTGSKISAMVVGLVGEDNISYYSDSADLMKKLNTKFKLLTQNQK